MNQDPVGIIICVALSSGLSLMSGYAAAKDVERPLGPISVSVTPEIRSTYISLGKLVEDRPMQIMDVHLGLDTSLVGVFGVRNWDVSSLTDRRADAHRHCLYHTEFGPYWQYDWKVSENVTLKTEFTLSWTLYRGFDDDDANKTYRWYRLDQSIENPYVTPFWRVCRSIEGRDFWYYKFGVCRAFTFCGSFYVIPSVFAEGGNDRYFRRTFGENTEGVAGANGASRRSPRVWGWGGRFAHGQPLLPMSSNTRLSEGTPVTRTRRAHTYVLTTTGRTARCRRTGCFAHVGVLMK